MSAISTWSTTAASNNSASPDGFPEGMAPSGVNDSAREVMAAVRTWYEDAQWIDYGYTHTYASGTSFTVAQDITADYVVGRRIRAVGSGTGTIEGSIATSSYSAPNTTVTVTWDSGSLQNESLMVSILILSEVKSSTVQADTISEITSANGVTVDGVSLKDGGVDVNGNAITLDADADLKAIADTDDRLDIELATKPVFSVDATEASSVNGLEIVASATGNPTKLQAQGDDTNIDVHIVPKGTGVTYGTPARENLIINGDFRFSQRSGHIPYTSTTEYPNNDDSYTVDRWLLLSDGNDRVDIDTSWPSESADAFYILLNTETVSGTSEKYGVCQIIEASDAAAAFRAGTVSLSFRAWTENSEVENIRAHVLSWDGTADAVTSDVVSAWGAEGSNPTFVANWTAENTASNLALTNASNTEYAIENIAVDTANAKNLAVFIHVDDTDLIADDRWFLAEVQLVPGPIALPFQQRSISEELRRCQRFFCKTYDLDVEPGSNDANGAVSAHGQGTSSSLGVIYPWRYPVAMRSTPTISLWNPADGTANEWDAAGGGTDIAATSAQVGDQGCRIRNNAACVDQQLYAIQAVADAEL